MRIDNVGVNLLRVARAKFGSSLKAARSFATRKRLARAALAGGLAALAFGTLAIAAPAWVRRQTSTYIYTNLAQVPMRPVGIVFGAGVRPDGTMSPVLQARVTAGVALDKAGKVRMLLMTGDNDRADYNEVTPMKAYAVAHGVPPQDVVRDYAGFHTYDSCYRARYVFQVHSAILVTQAFHLPRALYLARAMGIDAVGFTAQDAADPYTVSPFTRRERWTTIGSLLDVWDHHRPKYAGPADPIFGSDQANR